MRSSETASSSNRLETEWRELYRCDDLHRARAVATAIAAMEFDVRLAAGSLDSDLPDDRESAQNAAAIELHDEELPGPYIVEVPDDTWPQLADVLLEIIQEQMEFDQWLELRSAQRRAKLVTVLSVASVVEALAIWRLIES